MKKTTEYLKKTGKNFADSFRNINSSLLFTVVYDFIFYVFLMIAYNSYTTMLMKAMGPVRELGVRDFSPEMSRDALTPYLSAINQVYFNIFIYAAIFLIAAILIYSITNLLIWSVITSTKIQKSSTKFALKFLGLNYIWCVAWVALSIVIVWSVRTEVVKYWIFALLFIYAHISTMLWISYFMKKKIGKSIKSSFNLGISKIQHFIIPYVLAAVVFTALNFIIMPISKVYTGNLMTIYFIIFLFYFAWLRFYIYSIAKKIA